MAFWRNIGRALQSVWETITRPESPPPPVEFEDTSDEPFGYEEPEPEYDQGPFGDFFGGGEEPEEPSPPEREPGEEFIYNAGEGPYFDEWGPAEQKLWDDIVGGQSFEDQYQYDQVQYEFDNGWIRDDIEDRKYYRDYFLEDMDMVYFDWEAWREYMGYEEA